MTLRIFRVFLGLNSPRKAKRPLPTIAQVRHDPGKSEASDSRKRMKKLKDEKNPPGPKDPVEPTN
jgi:hypothetical protein